jgi:hypothetical protein
MRIRKGDALASPSSFPVERFDYRQKDPSGTDSLTNKSPLRAPRVRRGAATIVVVVAGVPAGLSYISPV